MPNLPPLPLSQMPGAYPRPPYGTPEFTAHALEVCDQAAVLDLLRHLNTRRASSPTPHQSTLAAAPAQIGAHYVP